MLSILLPVTTGFFNAFLTDLRFGDGSPSTDLHYYGFGLVQENFLLTFLFMTKPGGLLGLLGAGASGTLAEVEIRSQNENAKKIWTEMQRRKDRKENPTTSSRKNKRARKLAPSSRRDMTGKQRKRLSALEELMVEEDETPATEPTAPPADESDNAPEKTEAGADTAEGGVFGKIKGFYKQADSMAASQALLLNKELEDRGIVDKITDESGLKVVGKEAAAKAKAAKAAPSQEEEG